jgi:amino acid adenylation domain-containing protein
MTTLVADPDARFEPFPLSGMQEAYWIGRNGDFAGGGVSDHSYLEVDCVDLDLMRLERAWQAVIDRHEMLRAVILGDGRQRVLPETPPYRIEIHDLRAAADMERERQLLDARERWSHEVRPCDRWPLFAIRATLCGDGRTRLHVSLDGLLLDGLSYRIVLSDLVDLYASDGRPLPALEATFRDYVMTERRLREDTSYRRSRAYWDERLRTLPGPPALPLVCTPETLGQPRFTRHTFEMEPAPWQALKAHGARFGVTPTTILLTAYADVLAYWSESLDLTISVSGFNRLPLHPHVGRVAGNFASFGLLGVKAAGSISFAERAKSIQRQLWRDLHHRRVSGLELMRMLAHQRGHAAAQMPVVFTSTLGLGAREASAALADLGGVVYRVTQTPQVWLDLLVSDRDTTLLVDWDAVEALFPPGLVREMVVAHGDWVTALARDQDNWTRQGRSHLLPAHTRIARAAVNATDAPSPSCGLSGLFAQAAASRLDETAVVSATMRWTYRDLEHRVASIAQTLVSAGVGPDDVVPVMLDKGPLQIAAVLGIVASGAAYAPIDPAWPASRREQTIGQIGGRVVVTTASGVEQLPGRVRGIAVDTLPLIDDGWPPAVDGSRAYVLFTSGSSGAPKGVTIGTAGVVNAIAATNSTFAVGDRDAVLAVTGLPHDMSVYDVFGVLAAGGRVVVPEASRARDPEHWLALMQNERVTIWNSVPASVEMLLTYVETHDAPLPSTWRLAFLGGDWVTPDLVARLWRRCPGLAIVSVGGPTETTLWNIWHPVQAGEDPIPYGRPIANTRYAIVNEAGEPCPNNVKGELWATGVGLMHGYWRDPARSAAAWASIDGTRYYRTGDLGWYRPDQTIVFAGRRDLQVKLRGHRIEIEEIEAALRTHADVQQAAVALVGERPHQQLVAFIERRAESSAPGGFRE